MKVVGLLSGGKDSCYNLCHAAKQGHEVVALATLGPPDGTEELDSYMYQTVGHDAVHLVAQAMELPLYKRVISGKPVKLGSDYGSRLPLPHQNASSSVATNKTSGFSASSENRAAASTSSTAEEQDETEDLYQLLLNVKQGYPDVEGVSVGAILSNYQRVRVEHVCLRADLKLLPLAFLWQRHQSQLLDEMCSAELEAVLVKVAGIGLEAKHLGKSLAQMRPTLKRLNDLYGSHVCGEGGEYETLTLDCPLFKRRIVLNETTTQVHSDSGFASVAYLQIKRAHLEKKSDDASTLQDVPVPPLLDALGERTRRAAASLGGPGDAVSGLAASVTRSRLRTAGPTFAKAIDEQPLYTASKKGHLLAVGGIHGKVSGEMPAVAKLANVSDDPAAELQSQITTAFQRLQDALAKYDLCLAHIHHLNLYLRSQSDFAQMNQIYSSMFGSEPPSRACVGVAIRGGNSECLSEDAALSSQRIDLVEKSQAKFVIDAVALDDGLRYRPGGEVTGQPRFARTVVHVQGRSYWAAANIGPYSQSVRADSHLTISGQIGLRPMDLSLAEDVPTQHAMALQHARRILQVALDAQGRASAHWIESCICWLEDGPSSCGQSGSFSLLDERQRRLRTAKAAWNAQIANRASGSDSGSDAEDEAQSPSFDETWLGSHASPSSIPITYALLPFGALPRGAAVEWQLTANDGSRGTARYPADDEANDANQEADSDSDGDSEEGVEMPLFAEANELLQLAENLWRVQWKSAGSLRGKKGFAVVHATRISTTEAASLPAPDPQSNNLVAGDNAERKSAFLRNALSIRILYSEQVDEWEARGLTEELLQSSLAEGTSPPALTFVPVVSVFSHSGRDEGPADLCLLIMTA
ncbi:hypothetical protein IE81DRAFT_319817 [Ceraceosorus guamensis]|uniref:Diphthine--ammonia ligase n=1 Tax=Ceraceosorus guamensis TaxID=1522189 RepID=A0A316WF98_9BASI|nr:hypothetical protein IE81DRAFT_319817 [Ceraceosorus guamensis]PWN45965.1 hypothetical protein IE81DRAFT_319817 [Ceraceosorus guamensis]